MSNNFRSRILYIIYFTTKSSNMQKIQDIIIWRAALISEINYKLTYDSQKDKPSITFADYVTYLKHIDLSMYKNPVS